MSDGFCLSAFYETLMRGIAVRVYANVFQHGDELHVAYDLLAGGSP